MTSEISDEFLRQTSGRTLRFLLRCIFAAPQSTPDRRVEPKTHVQRPRLVENRPSDSRGVENIPADAEEPDNRLRFLYLFHAGIAGVDLDPTIGRQIDCKCDPLSPPVAIRILSARFFE